MTTAPVRTRVRTLGAPTTPLRPRSGLEQPASEPPRERCIYRCVAIDDLKPAKNRVRRHAKNKAAALKANIERFGCVVRILVTDDLEIIDGHEIWAACKELGYTTVEVSVVSNLAEAEVTALKIALHALSDLSAFDDPALAIDLKHLLKVDPLLVTYTALPMPRIDALVLPPAKVRGQEPPLALLAPHAGEPVTRIGDRWIGAGGCSFTCGDAKEPHTYLQALDGCIADFVLSDLPYCLIPIKGVVSRKHSEFIDGSSLSEAETDVFFSETFEALLPFVRDGAILDTFIDHRAMYALTGAARRAQLQHLCTAVWDKVYAGLGGLYRHQAEFILVLKKGNKAHTNNVQLGKHGRNRSTVWAYPGMAGFGAGRKEALENHATTKPIGLLVDAILDVTNLGEVVLDPFVGSGSTVIAAHRVQRIGVGIELDGRFVDVAVRRFEAASDEPMRHAQTGLTFAQTAEQRLGCVADGGLLAEEVR